MKPQVLFVGPTKSGTTWIDAYLRERGDVSLPVETKETFFFDKVYQKGFDWYESLFDTDPNKKVCVEVAPSLFHKEDAARRAAKHLGNAKIIVTVREPIGRAVSHYFHYRKAGEPKLPLMEMIKAKPDLIEPGLYFKNAKMWEQLFGADNVHFLYYEDLFRQPELICQQICDLLGLHYVPPSESLLTGAVNEAGVPRSLLLAKITRRTAETLRFLGANKLVNAIKSDKLRATIFSGGSGLEQERSEIKQQAESLRPLFAEDLEAFEKMTGRPVVTLRADTI